MPLFEQRVMVMLRSVRAFLNLQAGVTRSGVPPPSWLPNAEQSQELETARRKLESKEQELRELRHARPDENGAFAEAYRHAGPLRLAGVATDGAQKPVRAEQLIWMFGHSRTGSTWLSWMMAELENQERWHEPYVGMLFGTFIYQKLKDNRMVLDSPTFIMSESYRQVWLRSIRNFILDGAAARFPTLAEDQYLVVKEPNGSLGAPLIMDATPESRMIFLIRDPRDVIASRLEAFGSSGWAHQKRDYSTAEKLNDHTEQLANDYLKVVSKVQRAYEAHEGPKVLVRYEELRHDTVNVLKEIYATLGIEADEAQIEAAVAKHNWEQIPESDKGKDKFFRKAQPGSWKDDLTADQIELIEDITAPILSKFY